ncbi:hypothetical protein G6F43_006960 [Rhizopus delemar]|nr:hypothetical protein G6F43_006960 [Rhizopus delemar]
MDCFALGWISGVAGIIVGSPLDVLKARLQAPMDKQQERGSWNTLKCMVQLEGIGSMFKGVLSPIVGLAGLNALLFLAYGTLLRCFEYEKEPSLLQVYLAGAGAGFTCFLFSTPTDLVKIKAQITRLPKSSLQITKEVYQASGIKGFYQGGLVTVMRDSPSYGIYFWAYEGLKRGLDVNETTKEAWKFLLAGGLAGTLSWASIYPLDVVKSRLQMQYEGDSFETTRLLVIDRPYMSIKDCILRSYRSEGIAVFFRGLWPTLLRAFPVNAVTFYVYELMIGIL